MPRSFRSARVAMDDAMDDDDDARVREGSSSASTRSFGSVRSEEGVSIRFRARAVGCFFFLKKI